MCGWVVDDEEEEEEEDGADGTGVCGKMKKGKEKRGRWMEETYINK